MAVLRIWSMIMPPSGLPVLRADGLMEYQEVDFSGGEARSDPFISAANAGCIVSVLSDVECAVVFNGDDATTDGFPLTADERTDFYSEASGTVSVIAV